MIVHNLTELFKEFFKSEWVNFYVKPGEKCEKIVVQVEICRGDDSLKDLAFRMRRVIDEAAE